ncbi:MAG: LysM domain-containing protein [Chloroflexota bacterium]
MNRKRILTFVAIIALSAGLFSLLGVPTVSLNFADAQYSSDNDDDDDDNGNGGGAAAPAGDPALFTDGRVNDVVDAPTAIFCEQGSLAFYSALGNGNARLSSADLVAGVQQAVALGGSARILETGVATVDMFSNRTITVYAGAADGSIYQISVPLNVCGGIGAAQVNAAVAAVEEAASDSDEAGSAPLSEDGTYVVQPGDSLSSIADDYNTSVNALVEANNIEDPDRIINGQTLIIP